MSFLKNLTDAYPILKILGNRYVIVLVFFIVWMLFIDNTSYMEQRVLNKQLEELEDNKKYYQDEIRKDEEILYETR
jgi:cell division protein DivIC